MLKKSLLKLSLIVVGYLLLGIHLITFAKSQNKTKLEERCAQVKNKYVQAEGDLDRIGLQDIKIFFEIATFKCILKDSTEALKPCAKAAKLIEHLNAYWQIAYETAKKYSSKSILKGKDRMLIEKRLKVVNVVGHCLVMLGVKIEKANYILEEAVKVGEKLFPGNLLLADAYSHLAQSYLERTHKVLTAFDYYQRALQINLIRLGEKHIDTAKAYYNIARGYASFDRPKIACTYFKKSLNIMFKLPLQKSSSLMLKTYPQLGKIYEKQQCYAKAIKHYEAFLVLLPKLKTSKEQVSYHTEQTQSAIKRVQGEMDKSKHKEGTK